MGASTSINILNVDDKIAQIELDQGTLNVRVWKLSGDKSFEIDTPNLAFTVKNLGDYRIDVDTTNNTTTVTSRDGQAIVYGKSSSYDIKPGSSYRFSGTDLSKYETLALANPDDFDRWCTSRNRPEDAALSSTMVSPEVTGAADLNTYGTWQSDPTYKNVWFPKNVASDWVPFRDGQWVWIDPWGWSWIDNEIWGFAPFHYGR